MGVGLMTNQIDINNTAPFSGRRELAKTLEKQGLNEAPHIVCISVLGWVYAIFVVPMVHPDHTRWQKLAEMHNHMFITSC